MLLRLLEEQIIFEMKLPHTSRNFAKFRNIPTLRKKTVMQYGHFITVPFQNIMKQSLLFSYNDSWRHHTTLFCNFFFPVWVLRISHLLFSTAMSNKVREKSGRKKVNSQKTVVTKMVGDMGSCHTLLEVEREGKERCNRDFW